MNTQQVNQYIKKNHKLSYQELADQTGMTIDAVRARYKRLGFKPKAPAIIKLSPAEQLEKEVEKEATRAKQKEEIQKFKLLKDRAESAETSLDVMKKLEEVTTYQITSKKSDKGDATAVVLASDFHYEERVASDSVDGLNEFNLLIAGDRIKTFFVSTARLVNIKQQSITVDRLVLALLGDFITGNIHEEIDTLLDPAEAIIDVQNHIASGIEYLLENTNVEIIIPCHSGNHGRATKTIHQGNEHANSFEYLMYHSLANYFSKERRVKFLIAKGYHSYLDICGFKIRFHHGHNLKFGGGVGGIAISVRKAISQWNKAKPVDLDCFGHLHQLVYYSNFVCNGSLIGYNAYALAIKAEYEKPRQAFFLVNHGRKEVTDFSPVFLD